MPPFSFGTASLATKYALVFSGALALILLGAMLRLAWNQRRLRSPNSKSQQRAQSRERLHISRPLETRSTLDLLHPAPKQHEEPWHRHHPMLDHHSGPEHETGIKDVPLPLRRSEDGWFIRDASPSFARPNLPHALRASASLSALGPPSARRADAGTLFGARALAAGVTGGVYQVPLSTVSSEAGSPPPLPPATPSGDVPVRARSPALSTVSDSEPLIARHMPESEPMRPSRLPRWQTLSDRAEASGSGMPSLAMRHLNPAQRPRLPVRIPRKASPLGLRVIMAEDSGGFGGRLLGNSKANEGAFDLTPQLGPTPHFGERAEHAPSAKGHVSTAERQRHRQPTPNQQQKPVTSPLSPASNPTVPISPPQHQSMTGTPTEIYAPRPTLHVPISSPSFSRSWLHQPRSRALVSPGPPPAERGATPPLPTSAPLAWLASSEVAGNQKITEDEHEVESWVPISDLKSTGDTNRESVSSSYSNANEKNRDSASSSYSIATNAQRFSGSSPNDSAGRSSSSRTSESLWTTISPGVYVVDDWGSDIFHQIDENLYDVRTRRKSAKRSLTWATARELKLSDAVAETPSPTVLAVSPLRTWTSPTPWQQARSTTAVPLKLRSALQQTQSANPMRQHNASSVARNSALSPSPPESTISMIGENGESHRTAPSKSFHRPAGLPRIAVPVALIRSRSEPPPASPELVSPPPIVGSFEDFKWLMTPGNSPESSKLRLDADSGIFRSRSVLGDGDVLAVAHTANVSQHRARNLLPSRNLLCREPVPSFPLPSPSDSLKASIWEVQREAYTVAMQRQQELQGFGEENGTLKQKEESLRDWEKRGFRHDVLFV